MFEAGAMPGAADANIAATENELSLGLTFLPTDNITFEANLGIAPDNLISVFDPSGLLSFANLLVSVKW
jgi:hypothetical protein